MATLDWTDWSGISRRDCVVCPVVQMSVWTVIWSTEFLGWWWTRLVKLDKLDKLGWWTRLDKLVN